MKRSTIAVAFAVVASLGGNLDESRAEDHLSGRGFPEGIQSIRDWSDWLYEEATGKLTIKFAAKINRSYAGYPVKDYGARPLTLRMRFSVKMHFPDGPGKTAKRVRVKVRPYRDGTARGTKTIFTGSAPEETIFDFDVLRWRYGPVIKGEGN